MGPEPRRLPHLLGAWLLLGASAAGAGVPALPLADRGPLNGLVGFPDGWVAPDEPAVEISWQIASNAMGQQAAEEYLLLDGETHALTLRLQRRLGERLALGIALPWIAHSGGFLDDPIDAWHDALGLSEGIRPDLPENDLRYAYGRDGHASFEVDHPTSGLGDLRSSAAWRLGDPAAATALDLTADVEWPTGDARRLTGSGGIDVAAGLRVARAAKSGGRGLERLGWSARAGLLWPGATDAPLPPPAGQVPYYDAALAWAATPSLDLIVQLDGHGRAFQSGLRMTGGNVLQLGAGFAWGFAGRYALRLAVFEDVRTDTTADFTVELAISRR